MPTNNRCQEVYKVCKNSNKSCHGRWQIFWVQCNNSVRCFRFSILISCAAVTTERPSRTPNPYFRRRFGYTSTTKAPTTTAAGDARRIEYRGTTPHSDQELEPSILDNKFINSRFNQIELVGEQLSDGVAEAITTISRAPLPFVGTTTVRHVKLTTPGSIKYDDEFDYQITKRADLLTTTSEF